MTEISVRRENGWPFIYLNGKPILGTDAFDKSSIFTWLQTLYGLTEEQCEVMWNGEIIQRKDQIKKTLSPNTNPIAVATVYKALSGLK